MARIVHYLVVCLSTAAVVPATQATLQPRQSGSDVPGAAFNRIFHVWLENVDYDAAAADINMQWLADNGILLTNYYAVTHPSEPNYIASVGGDTFGLQNDGVNSVPANISTVVDILDSKGISWAEYQEGMPSAGYQGASSGGYVRKHNPLISFDSVSKNSTRLARIKKFSDFNDDLSNGSLPQWAFFTPNITNDGHNTNITYSAKWLRGWLEPLLKNDDFTNGTLVVVTFDENDTYEHINRVYTVLLGGAIDPSLRGTTDSMYFNHYSAISSVSANWDSPSLGRWDCDANLFTLVANKTHYRNTNVSSYDGLWWNVSYPGPLNKKETTSGWWPKPATELKCATGRGVLPSIISTWGRSRGSYNYTSVYPYDNVSDATKGRVSAIGTNDASSPSTSALPAPSVSDSGAKRTPGYAPVPKSVIVSSALAWLLGAA